MDTPASVRMAGPPNARCVHPPARIAKRPVMFVSPPVLCSHSYAGHLHDLVWVRPPWAHQIADGTTQFAVGAVAAGAPGRLSQHVQSI
jgi:hypothetical protein